MHIVTIMLLCAIFYEKIKPLKSNKTNKTNKTNKDNYGHIDSSFIK